MNTPASILPAPGREQLAGLLQAHGVLPTEQRLEIAQALFARPQHLSAEQILAQVNAAGGSVSKATVYNTLGLFVEKGLIREVIVDPQRVFYDPTTHAHHHFYNLSTGELTDIDAADLGLQSLPRLPDGTEVAGVDVIIRLRPQAA